MTSSVVPTNHRGWLDLNKLVQQDLRDGESLHASHPQQLAVASIHTQTLKSRLKSLSQWQSLTARMKECSATLECLLQSQLCTMYTMSRCQHSLTDCACNPDACMKLNVWRKPVQCPGVHNPSVDKVNLKASSCTANCECACTQFDCMWCFERPTMSCHD